MIVKSTVLTKANFNKDSLNGKKIIGKIQSGNGTALPMYHTRMHVYTPQQDGMTLINAGLIPNTINTNIILGIEHQNADLLTDFNLNVKSEAADLATGVICDFGFAQIILKDSTTDATKLIEVSINDIVESKTFLFAITYSCEETTDHYHVVWAKLTIAVDPINSVQVIWELVSE